MVSSATVPPNVAMPIVLAVPGVAQAMAIEQKAPREPGGSRLVLLLVLRDGISLDRALMLRIKKELSQQGSSNHVPAVVAQVKALPMTHSGKYSEKAVRDLLDGRPLSNRMAIRNPESLDAISSLPELRPLP